jgi:uncharacterized protein (UPF0332 family)
LNQHCQKLLDKSSHSLRAARLLLEGEELESAISRVYYSMFYVAEALLFERGLAFRKHSAVHAAFGREFAKTRMLDPKYHRWLLKAFEDRLQTDYGIEATVTDEDVETALARAEEFLDQARTLLNASPAS